MEEAWAYLQGIVDTVREPFVVMGGDLRVVWANRSFYQTFQVSPKETEGRVIYELGNGQWNIPALQRLLEQILSNNTQFENFEFEYEFPAIGRKIMLLNARKLSHPSTHTEMILLAIEDISEKRQKEQALHETNEQFRLLVENARDYAMLVLDTGGNIVSWTAGAERIMGWQETEVRGQHTRLIFTPEDREDGVPEKEIRKAEAEGRAEDKRWHLCKDGSRFFADGVLISLRDDNGSLRGFGKVFLDATERKRTEEALQESQRLLSTLMGNLPGMAYRYLMDEGYTFEFASEGCVELTGYYPSDFSAKGKVTYAEVIHPEDVQRVREEVGRSLEARESFTVVYRITAASGAEKWVWDKGLGIYGADGRILAVEGFVTDITESKQAEEQIKASLQEKEVLLKEVHHRVKNNLQIIDSLLRHQCRHTKDKQLTEILKECQNRVNSMALLHEKLYQSKDLSKIDFTGYIKSLVANLFDSYSVNANVTTLKINVDDIFLDIETALPCGLIVNELVSNSLKYAFGAGERGEIHIKFHSIHEHNFLLSVKDNGVGLPSDFDFHNLQSLGLKLVKSLVRQLGGTIEINGSGGTEFRITFSGVKDNDSN